MSGGADAGFTLLAPAECAQKLWLALVALGAHATGLREWRWLAVAAGAPAFPEDFPASAAAAEEAERAAALARAERADEIAQLRARLEAAAAAQEAAVGSVRAELEAKLAAAEREVAEALAGVQEMKREAARGRDYSAAAAAARWPAAEGLAHAAPELAAVHEVAAHGTYAPKGLRAVRAAGP